MKKILFAITFLMPILAFSQRYHIGDTVYSPANEKAVVFYVFDDGNHGWAVSLTDCLDTKFWSVAGNCITVGVQWTPERPATDPIIPLYFPRIPVSANTVYGYSPYLENIEGWMVSKELHDSADARYSDGAYGMYPAFYAGNFNNGWYIPTAGQMRKLYSSEVLVKNTIIGLGGRWLQGRKYWTATVANDSCPITLRGNIGRLEPSHISGSYYVRTIRNFGFVSDITKDKYYCRGDKVVDLGYEFYAENDTLISRTYTSYQGFDSIVHVNIHILEPEYALAGNMLVCMGLNTEISVTHGAGPFNYAWKDELNPNEPIGTSSSLSLTNVTEGHQYSVTVGQYFEQVQRYCAANTPFEISVIETDVAISGGGIVCYNSSETLSVPDDDNLEYVWYQPSAPDNHLGTGSTYTTSNLTTPTTYAVSVSGGTCTGTGSITVNVAPEFSVSINGDNSVCYGENANLVATPSSNEMVTYTWFNGENNEMLGTQNSISTANLYENSQFIVNAVKTSGVAPSVDNVFVGDIVTSNNIVVRPSMWMEAEIQNLEAIGVVYAKNNDSVRVVSLDEYTNIPWGASRFTTSQYAATYSEARTKMNGKAMTDAIVAYNNSQTNPTEANYVAALKAREKGENWYLPAEGELFTMENNLANVNYAISMVGGTEVDANSYYWSVTEKTADRAWASLGTGTQDDSKATSHIVRPVTAFIYSDLINFRNSATCRANDTRTVAVTPQQIGNATATVELGQSFTYRDSTAVFNNAGEFDLQWTFHNAGDCDSIVNIAVTVLPITVTVTPETNQHKNCGHADPIFQYSLSENIDGISGVISREEGESVGTYHYTLGTLDAGDNYVLVLNENSPMFEILTIYNDYTIAQCDSYEWNGTTYTVSGDYTQTLTSVAGCDSIVTLHLTVHSSDTTFIDDTVCLYYTYNNPIHGQQTYTASGTYYNNLYSANGCDSIVAIRLVVIGDHHDNIYEVSCGEYVYNGYTYYDSGDYPIVYMTPYGCYKTDTLHLTVYYTPAAPQATTTPNTLCSGGSDGSIIVTSPINDNYEYSIDGVNFQSSPEFTNVREGTYTLIVRNGNCTNEADFVVESLVIRPTAIISESTEIICEGENLILSAEGSSEGNNISYSWTGPNGYTSINNQNVIPNATTENAGVYQLIVHNDETNCDISASINITVNEASYGTDVQSACNSYTWIDGNTYFESTNEPTFTLINANGCDSIVTLNLTILHSESTTDEISICPSELPYEYNEQLFTEAGTYDVHLSAENGCDSIVTLTLNVYEGFNTTINVDVCENDLPYIFNDTSLNETGTYTFILSGALCDSVVTLVLNVNEEIHETINVNVCEFDMPYTFGDSTLNEAGTYTFILPSTPCDSVVTLVLNVYEEYQETINVDICEYDMPYTFGDSTLNEAGTYSFRFSSTSCDSVITLVLNVHNSPEISVSQTTNDNEITITAEGALTYEWETGETTPSITVEAANDTIWVIGYSEYNCADTVEVIINELTGIDGIQSTINIYPIPSNGVVFVESENMISVDVVDLNGKTVKTIPANLNRIEIELDVPSGEYFLRIETEYGLLTRKILIMR
ncbi:MAG: T9SS type A sorting domain-containing protein [Bacteroidales bacterium]|nr:T9SS type A sorting domain-containing protein [Bacteroidales bacterium]